MKVFCKMFTVITGIVIASLSFSEEAFSPHRKKEKEKSIVTLDCKLELVKTHRIGRFLHSVFGEFFGDVIYDGIWVGKDSKIPNIDGLRKDVIEGCREASVTAFRWPGGCCADHYHWKDNPFYARLEWVIAVFVIGIMAIYLITPSKPPLVGSSGGFFPFSLGRQPVDYAGLGREPAAIGHSFEPTDPDYGIVFTPWNSSSFESCIFPKSWLFPIFLPSCGMSVSQEIM